MHRGAVRRDGNIAGVDRLSSVRLPRQVLAHANQTIHKGKHLKRVVLSAARSNSTRLVQCGQGIQDLLTYVLGREPRRQCSRQQPPRDI